MLAVSSVKRCFKVWSFCSCVSGQLNVTFFAQFMFISLQRPRSSESFQHQGMEITLIDRFNFHDEFRGIIKLVLKGNGIRKFA